MCPRKALILKLWGIVRTKVALGSARVCARKEWPSKILERAVRDVENA